MSTQQQQKARERERKNDVAISDGCQSALSPVNIKI